MSTWHGAVERTEWLTPALVRVVLGGPGLRGFEVPDATDTYVNVMEQYYPAGAVPEGRYPELSRRPHRSEIDAVVAAARTAGLWRFDERWRQGRGA